MYIYYIGVLRRILYDGDQRYGVRKPGRATGKTTSIRRLLEDLTTLMPERTPGQAGLELTSTALEREKILGHCTPIAV